MKKEPTKEEMIAMVQEWDRNMDEWKGHVLSMLDVGIKIMKCDAVTPDEKDYVARGIVVLKEEAFGMIDDEVDSKIADAIMVVMGDDIYNTLINS